MKRFPHILEPLDFGFTKLRNRVVMGSIHTGLEGGKAPKGTVLQEPFARLARFYADRAKGGAGLIITGGFAPSAEGVLHPGERILSGAQDMDNLRRVTDAVHEHGGHIALQMLHPGRYSNGDQCVAPSAIMSPISYTKKPPTEMSVDLIKKTVEDFANMALFAKKAGFDGVEIMGSEGYLLNQFCVQHTNIRTDDYGGSYENRIRFPLEVLKAVRSTTGDDFLIVYRVSLVDLVPDGSTQPEVFELAERVAQSGASIINTGIGWHEARVPTIATSVPRAGYTWATRAVRKHLRSKGIETPIVAVNRMNHPQVLEEVLASGDADMVGMARPFLADAFFMQKVMEGKEDRINVCIGCNEACLDHTFTGQLATCMLNPEACYEEERAVTAAAAPKTIAVVGGGPAGAGTAITLARRGHNVTIFEKTNTLGGQFNLAKLIPGKEEFQSSIDYWTHELAALPNVTVHMGTEATTQMLANGKFDEVIVATGCHPRAKSNSTIPGIEGKANVFSYTEALANPDAVGKRVAVIGAGGIGFDMSEFLVNPATSNANNAARFAEKLTHSRVDPTEFHAKWGIQTDLKNPGGIQRPKIEKPARQLTLFQRSKGKVGAKLGATTGWIHRLELRMGGVKEVNGVEYKSFDGKVFTYEKDGETVELAIDSIVLCTGQESYKELLGQLGEQGNVHSIGGCNFTKRLDAKLAILQGHELAMKL